MSPKTMKVIIISMVAIIILLLSGIVYLLLPYLNIEKEKVAEGNEPVASTAEREIGGQNSDTIKAALDENMNEQEKQSEFIEEEYTYPESKQDYTNDEKIEPIEGVMYKGKVYNKSGDMPTLEENAPKSEVDEYSYAISRLRPVLGKPIYFDDLTRNINIPDAPELSIQYFSTDIVEYELESLGEGAEINFFFSNLSDDYNLDVMVQELYVDGHYIEEPYYSLRAKVGHGDSFQDESINISSVTPFADEPIGYFPEFKESIVGQFVVNYEQVEKDLNQEVPTTIRIPFVIDL
ncbi:hypothetical protein JOC78_003467 [Bacillus ectoiniformans]|uniref:hypothetical protein n=1 Tax=Bacillus ectoiniformans TaxID=1494429 RepID=UPI00195D1898|nr:hypothetical protein [Bacillus ectoiniformans]MBM7650475.1 hypothetical protein [Bacillus ectoiniformans]